MRMKKTDYNLLYKKIFKILSDFTPLTVDCGVLCNCACCKGDNNTGMRLFPFEDSKLEVKSLDNGVRLAICNGKCNRNERPLACRIFPFFPTIDEKGRVYVELDYRGYRLCPIVTHSDDLLFDPKFLKAVKKVGKLLVKDDACKNFLLESTNEIDTYKSFLE